MSVSNSAGKESSEAFSMVTLEVVDVPAAEPDLEVDRDMLLLLLPVMVEYYLRFGGGHHGTVNSNSGMLAARAARIAYQTEQAMDRRI